MKHEWWQVTAWNKMQGSTAAFKCAIQIDVGSLLAKPDDVVQDKMDGNPPIQAEELRHQMGTQMAWWCCFLDKTTFNIENQGKCAKWKHDARGNAPHNVQGNAWQDV
jgi:hypothetical protein